MKKLGLIGGTGPESTVMYYRGLINGVGELLGHEVLPPLIIDSLSPFDVFRFCTADDRQGLTEYLVRAVDNLAAGGATVAAMTAATTHLVFDDVRERSPIPLISMIDATVSEARSRGITRVGFLGTRFTMTRDFFVTPFEDAGISVTLPGASDMDTVQLRIASELEHGIVTDGARRDILSIIGRLQEQGNIEQLVLGCTELPLILDDDVSPVPCLDPVPIHVRALVHAITVGVH